MQKIQKIQSIANGMNKTNDETRNRRYPSLITECSKCKNILTCKINSAEVPCPSFSKKDDENRNGTFKELFEQKYGKPL